MAATETLLGKLHGALAQKYIDELESGAEITPALLTSISNFLKQNGITCEVGDEDMDELADKASNVTSFPFDRKADAS